MPWYASRCNDDGSPVCGCPCFTDGTVDMVTSGISVCAVCHIQLSGGKDYSLTFTSVNGMFELAWNEGAAQFVSEEIGTLTKSDYNSENGSCTDLTGTTAIPIFATASCFGGVWRPQIWAFTDFLVSGFLLFNSSGQPDHVLGFAIPSILECGDLIQDSAFGGFATITR